MDSERADWGKGRRINEIEKGETHQLNIFFQTIGKWNSCYPIEEFLTFTSRNENVSNLEPLKHLLVDRLLRP